MSNGLFLGDMVSWTYELPKECFKQILSLNEQNSKADGAIEIGECYSRLAMFYLQHLTSAHMNSPTETEALIVKSILRAMRYSSKAAQIQFPRLFELRNIEHPDMVALFNLEVRK